MWFASPLWLLALVPWAAVSIWLLWGRHPNAAVPFLELWRGAIVERPPRAGMQTPPLATVLAVGAMLLAILAAAGPMWRGRGTHATPLNIVIDRGFSMSAAPKGVARFVTTAQQLSKELGESSPQLPLRVTFVPGEASKLTDAAHLESVAQEAGPSAVQTGAMIDRAVMRQLRDEPDAVIVATDQPLGVDDPRIIRVGPEDTVEDVGISALAARESPRPQVMVGVFNQSNQTQTTVDIASADQHVRQALALPPRGQERNYFVDVPELGDTIEASLEVRDDLPADDHAWLVREEQRFALDVRMPLYASAQRMIDAYRKLRPPARSSAQSVIVIDDPQKLPANQRGVIVATSFGNAASKIAALSVTDHPITRALTWGGLPIIPAASEPPEGWTPLVSSGGKTIVAIRDQPARQVWIGFSTEAWSDTTQFVIFWSNVLDWLCAGDDRFVSSPLESKEAGWTAATSGQGQPGIYVNSDGERKALDAFAARLPVRAVAIEDWQTKISHAADARNGLSLARWAAIGTLVFLLGATIFWRKRPAKVPAGQLAAT